MQWLNAEKSLEKFIEEDLPLLSQPHYKDTIEVMSQILKRFEISWDNFLAKYPNYPEWVQQQILQYFTMGMKEANPCSNAEFYSYYGLIATQYQKNYLYYFVENQFKSLIPQLKEDTVFIEI